ncbi:MAG: amino acid adenylation domain-containing protein, partial [Mucilaginibacter sp.]
MSNLILSDKELFELELDYWRGKLQGVAPIHLFTDHIGRAKEIAGKANINFYIDEETYKQLGIFCEVQNVTLFATLLATFNVLLFRYSGQDDICVGNIIPGSGNDGTLPNVLALRTEINSDDHFTNLLKRVAYTINEAYKHQRVPFGKVIDTILNEQNMDWNPLFQVMFAFQNGDNNNEPQLLELYKQKISGSDLSFSMNDKGNKLQCLVEYNTDLYTAETIKLVTKHYTQLLNSIIVGPDSAIDSLPMLTKTEEHELLEELNDTTVGYPKDKTVLDVFEEQVKLTPDNIAVGFEDKTLTYKELNSLSNQLGEYLKKTYQIKPDDLIGIKLERSEWMIVAILGILKSGGAYVPMDPAYPEERIAYMVEDSNCKALIDDDELDEFRKTQDKYSQENQTSELKPHHLIYCIYTSGSTGKPKGVLLEHSNVVRLLINDKPLFDFNQNDVWTMFHSCAFDFSVWEMYGAILFGGKVIVVTKQVAQDSDAFLNLIKRESVTILNQTPSSFYNLIDADSRSSISQLDLRYIIFGGEALQPARLAGWKEKYMDTRLINMYGITETTVHVTYKEIGIEEINNGASNIGVPIPTLSCYVLNEYLQFVPIGTVGELFVGGAGLARGYLNRPELTAEKFIQNPHKPEERIYRSGDLARLLPDGNLEYLGRIDDQVKMRGFRIELGEIASALLKHLKVNDAVVIAKAINGQDRELIAYTTGKANASELRDFLSKKLPSYMVPGYYIQLESIPLTSNGKVNKKLLPEPINSGIDEVDYVAPSTNTEKALVRIWSEVLGLEAEEISVKGNFFDMGGHSIKAIRLLGQIHKELGVKLVLKELFSGNTIEQQAIAIAQKELNRYNPIQIVDEQPDYAVSSAQRRLWVLNHFEGAQSAYNIPSVILLDGALDKLALNKAFQTLITRHEILRTVFKEDSEGNPRQKVIGTDKFTFKLKETDLRRISDQQAQLNHLVNLDVYGSFDLSEGPLLRCHLIQLSNNKHVLVIVQHHIISDGWSMDIFRKELSSLYNGFVLKRDPNLPILGIQYKDYAAWHTKQLEAENVLPHKEYWLQQFDDEIPLLELPADKERPAVKSYNGSGFSTIIDTETVLKLSQVGKANGGTLFMSLLACVNTLFYRYTGQEDIVIGSPIAGREHPDLEDQIGFYINTLALRTRFSGTGSYEDLYQHIKEVTLGAYEHQLYPYDELVDMLKLPRNMNRNPLFDVMVVLQNSMEQDSEFMLNGLQAKSYETGDYRVSKFDINFIFSETK